MILIWPEAFAPELTLLSNGMEVPVDLLRYEADVGLLTSCLSSFYVFDSQTSKFLLVGQRRPSVKLIVYPSCAALRFLCIL